MGDLKQLLVPRPLGKGRAVYPSPRAQDDERLVGDAKSVDREVGADHFDGDGPDLLVLLVDAGRAFDRSRPQVQVDDPETGLRSDSFPQMADAISDSHHTIGTPAGEPPGQKGAVVVDVTDRYPVAGGDCLVMARHEGTVVIIGPAIEILGPYHADAAVALLGNGTNCGLKAVELIVRHPTQPWTEKRVTDGNCRQRAPRQGNMAARTDRADNHAPNARIMENTAHALRGHARFVKPKIGKFIAQFVRPAACAIKVVHHVRLRVLFGVEVGQRGPVVS